LDKKILIIKAGKKLPALSHVEGDFEDWISSGMGLSQAEFEVISVFEGTELPDCLRYKAVLITGSSAMVTDHTDWIENTAAWLRQAVEQQLPVLGICFGHQLLAYALGGQVADNPNGVEVGSVEAKRCLDAAGDVFLDGSGKLWVQASHRQCVTRLPEAAVCLLTTDMDKHHAFRFRDHVWGFQFHPEFNVEITRQYIHYYADDLHSSDRDEQHLSSECRQTPEAHSCLRSFSVFIQDRAKK